jgi:hypothetical protein
MKALFLLFAAACCAGVVYAAGASPAAGPGCLERDIHICIDYLKTRLAADDWKSVDSQLESMNTLDVNGKRIGGSEVMIDAKLPGFERGVTIWVTFAKNGLVKKVRSGLLSDPGNAQTRDDYDKTGLFEITNAVIGPDCPSLERLHLYQFFENTVKHHWRQKGDSTDFTDTDVSTTHGRHADDIPFCGKRFSYDQSFGVDTSLISEYNASGSYELMDVIFR